MAIDKNAIERETKKKTTGYLNEELNSFNAGIDAENARITENGEKTIETTKQGYEDVFRKNRLNQIINEEKVKERMVNLGLTDSGLNRTQQTAIQLQAANADAAAVRNRQAAVDEIRRGISDAIALNDAKKADYARERTSYWNEKADAMIANEYNIKVAEENARIEAELKAAEAWNGAYKELITYLNDSSKTQAEKISALKTFNEVHGFSSEEEAGKIAQDYGLGTLNNGVFTVAENIPSGTAFSGIEIDPNHFNPDKASKDNFGIKVNGETYRVQELGKVTESGLLKILDNTETKNGENSLISYGGELYLKIPAGKEIKGRTTTEDEYYKLGNTTILGVPRARYTALKNELNRINSEQ